MIYRQRDLCGSATFAGRDMRLILQSNFLCRKKKKGKEKVEWNEKFYRCHVEIQLKNIM